MRAAADAESPYALSEQSRPGKGFSVARPETAIAAFPAPARTKGRGRAVRPVVPSGDESSGEPIRLTSAEAVANTAPAMQGRSTPAGDVSTPSGPQAAASEIPTLTAPEIPTLTAIPSSPGPANPGPGASPTSNPDLTAASGGAVQLPTLPTAFPDASSSRRDVAGAMPPRDDATQVSAAMPELPSDPAPRAARSRSRVRVSRSRQPRPPPRPRRSRRTGFRQRHRPWSRLRWLRRRHFRPQSRRPHRQRMRHQALSPPRRPCLQPGRRARLLGKPPHLRSRPLPRSCWRHLRRPINPRPRREPRPRWFRLPHPRQRIRTKPRPRPHPAG